MINNNTSPHSINRSRSDREPSDDYANKYENFNLTKAYLSYNIPIISTREAGYNRCSMLQLYNKQKKNTCPITLLSGAKVLFWKIPYHDKLSYKQKSYSVSLSFSKLVFRRKYINFQHLNHKINLIAQYQLAFPPSTV